MELFGLMLKVIQVLIVDGQQIIQAIAIFYKRLWMNWKETVNQLAYMHHNICGVQYLAVHQHVLTSPHYLYGIHIMINCQILMITKSTNLVDGILQISNNIQEQLMCVVLELIWIIIHEIIINVFNQIHRDFRSWYRWYRYSYTSLLNSWKINNREPVIISSSFI
jgi:hypothetical protein